MAIITVGIDLAKNVFAVHGVNDTGKAELFKPKVPREQLLDLIPTVLSVQEVKQLLQHMDGITGLVAHLRYGTGMRLMEVLRLQVKAARQAFLRCP